MKELVEKVAALYADFSKDANAQLENGNKAAGTRARKASLEIEKAMTSPEVLFHLRMNDSIHFFRMFGASKYIRC